MLCFAAQQSRATSTLSSWRIDYRVPTRITGLLLMGILLITH